MTPHRITTRRTDEHVVVSHDGVVLAETRKPLVLSEQGLPDRYYLPPEDVRTDLLEPSTTTSHCPFKGDASYLSAPGARDAFWFYEQPIEGRDDITGFIAPWPGRVEISVE
ncbi:MAG: hypothetical protein AVDCRST_MAG85-2881 [uncultured Solirubrobacteraceae bacterium]|uniref:DUF427 domain-containing protein n=1 Tax=uncultured Solirubrobacteraceae bacterium TaxID=1162706 RepID=A0A6J4TET2_9ACTN|nr:MAG: hypothetical protein AVDCRST_MAG85-2881 [uncultured Solirubrobacteraceae bacterium]